MVDGRDKFLALLAHCGYLLLGLGYILIPLGIYFLFDGKNEFVAGHAKQAFKAQAIIGIMALIASVLSFVLIGLVLWPFIAVIGPTDANSMTYADAGAAIQSMQIAAYEKGLGCCWLGAINRQNLHGILGLAEKQQVLFLLAVGVPDEQPVSEDITDPKDVNYYLDDANRLHIPKLTVDAITKWL